MIVVEPSSSDSNHTILFPSPSQLALLTLLELLTSQVVPFVRLLTERAAFRECVVKLYVVVEYRANDPSALGIAAPRRGALSIASGVKRGELEELEAAFTARVLESRRATREKGDRMAATIEGRFPRGISRKRNN